MPDAIRCSYCFRGCLLGEGAAGACGVICNSAGALVSVPHQRYAAQHLDPIEKKPLYHFFPGAQTYSIGMFGCNLSCDFCQNHSLVRGEYPVLQEETPSDILEGIYFSGSAIVSYTYSEPLVWQPSFLPIAREVRRRGGLNVLVTNGTFSTSALSRLSLLIDAVNIDLKGNDVFYRDICHAKGAFQAVMDSIAFWAERSDAVLEVTTLLIDGYHTAEWIEDIGRDLASSGVKVWHLSRFFPSFRMSTTPPTSATLMSDAYEAALTSGVDHVYLGNVEHSGNHFITCPSCHHSIHRREVNAAADENGTLQCPSCGRVLYGRFGTPTSFSSSYDR